MKQIIFLIIAFNSLTLIVSGSVPDSLENRLKRATADSAKVMIYNDFVKELMIEKYRDYYQILHYAQQGLIFAEQIQFERGQAEMHRTVGNVYFYLTDYEKAIENYEKALNICENMQDYNGIALNYYNMNIIYGAQSKTYFSLDVLLKALSIWKQLGNTNYQITAYRGIIELYQDIGELHLAEIYAKEAIRLAIETGNQRQEAYLYDMIAHINVSIGDVEVAKEYYQKSLQIFEELDEQLQFARVTHNFAFYIHSDNPEIAIGLIRRAAAIYEEEAPTNISLFEIYNNLANMFQLNHNNDSTRYYKEKALRKAIFSGNSQTMATAYDTLGRFYLKIGNIDRAENNFHKAYDVALKSGLYDIQSNALSGLSSVSYQKGDYKSAFDYRRKYQFINDSLNREENIRNVQKLTQQYEFERDMTEKNEIIKAQLKHQHQAIKQQKTVVSIISVALMCAAVLLVFIIRSNKRNKLANIKLEQQHNVILRINDELKESHCELFNYKDHLEEMVKEQTEKLKQSELQLRTLSDNLPGGCIYQKHVFHDGKEIFSYISNTAEEWLGISAETIMGDIDRFYRQMSSDDLEKKRQLEKDSIASMSSYSYIYRLIKDNQEVWLLENALPRINENQTIVWDGIIVNITDRKKFEKELIQAKEHAEESDRLKSAFLANMSHEIRTPMNGIVGFLGFIERDNLPAEKRQTYTGIIRSNVQQLLQLIGDIIDISKIDSHSLSLHQVTFDLNNLLDELEIFFQDFILKREKKLVLILDQSQSILPCIIQSDPVRIRQILSNLIGNAIKFTDMGYVKFGYYLTEQNDRLYFYVEDTGIGIPESKQNHIFERFRQAHDEEMQTTYGGTGLGLAISKSIVELMGGHIGVESKEDVGSTFCFSLPFHQITEYIEY